MPRRTGETRHNPDRVIDTWIYKVKDVEFETREYVEGGEEDTDERGRDTRPRSERYEFRKQRVKNKLVKVELRYCKETLQSDEPPHPTKNVSFEVYCDELDLKMAGTDIEALRAAVWERLDKRFEIKWEAFFLVTVNRERPWHGDGTGMMFSYDVVYRGTTWDGKFLLKQYDGSEFKIKPWPGEFTDKGGNVLACIPVTDMNREALEQFAKRIDILRGKLADFLRPENILQTLANLSGLALLPPVPVKAYEAEE